MDIRERMQQLIGDYAGTENLRVVAVEWLKEIEWCNQQENEDGELYDRCPVCAEVSWNGHEDSCWLAGLIDEAVDDGDQR